nr:ORF6N domain-containing protein [Geothrix fermentans]
MALPVERILHAIHLFRKDRVLLDADLAELYGVETRVLVQAIKRNAQRFPADFMFQLSDGEWAILKSQSGISRSWGGRRTAPYAFTELGVAMLSSVLNSERAIRDLREPPVPARKPIGFRPKR